MKSFAKRLSPKVFLGGVFIALICWGMASAVFGAAISFNGEGRGISFPLVAWPPVEGDAVAADLLVGKTASNADGTITGTRPLSVVLKSGQATSYTAGDDGDLEAGEAPPTPRFLDNGDGTVTDLATRLMWVKDVATAGAQTWTGAVAYATALELAGHTDWRSPSVKELQSLSSYENANPALITGHPFAVGAGDIYVWSGSTRKSTPANGWYMFLGDGFTSHTAKTNSTQNRAWPVRGPIPL
jgi:hypothetical protein